MNKNQFPFVALGIGLFMLLLVIKGSELGDDGTTIIPLLTLLIVSEFAFFVTAVGAYLGIRQIQANGIKPLNAVITLLCMVLAVGFLWLGIVLWPFSP
jgi:heme/copper-type cytochrome/quinol oxidase subunit 3